MKKMIRLQGGPADGKTVEVDSRAERVIIPVWSGEYCYNKYWDTWSPAYGQVIYSDSKALDGDGRRIFT